MDFSLLLAGGGFWGKIGEALNNLWQATGLFQGADWRNYVMLAISFILFYLAIVKGFEPLLMLPIAFGMFIVNIPGVYHILFGTKGYVITENSTNVEVARGTLSELQNLFANPNLTAESLAELLKGGAEINGRLYGEMTLSSEQIIRDFGLFYYIYKGVDWVIFPPIIFLGIGCMTDFGPLIANPKSMIIGAAAQLGIFITFFGALCLLGFNALEAGAIAIIGGADGPTAIYVTKKLAEHLLPAIAISAYSYMALIPIIQKPIMKLLTTDKERKIRMKQLRTVSKLEKIVFPLAVSLVVGLLLPDAMPLLGMLMLGNLLKESGQTERIAKAAQNELMNIITILLGISVGATTSAQSFLNLNTLKIVLLGLIAFSFGTAGGVLFGKILYAVTKGKINPLIGSAGVSAVPMAARVSQKVGQAENPSNFLLMHAMGPNVSGVIGSAVAAGILLTLLG